MKTSQWIVLAIASLIIPTIPMISGNEDVIDFIQVIGLILFATFLVNAILNRDIKKSK